MGFGLAAAACMNQAQPFADRSSSTPARRRPHIVLILADDMGYSDIGAYGGMIRTPHLDRLAAGGIKYSNFYTTPRCCPSRAALLTGLQPHQCGMGWMTAATLPHPGYVGSLNRHCRTIPEVLRTAGYSSYISGKWHLSRNDPGLADAHPLARGFDRFFGIVGGSSSYFNPKFARLGRDPAACDPGNFYLTDAITDHACAFINDHHRSRPEQPFFTYVAYNAPHWPLHAKPADIDRYRGAFSKGWDTLPQEKYERMKALKLLDGWRLSERDAQVAAWADIPADKREEFDLRMAIYAAQVDSFDQGVGRIMETLRTQGIADDTLVLFLSDNGGCHEEIHWKTPELRLIGTEQSYESYGRPWANYSNAPYRMFKSWVHEGGIASPSIAHWPNGISRPGTVDHSPAHSTDLMPTFCELGGAKYPAGGDDQVPRLMGASMAGSFRGEGHKREVMFWEHEGNRALRIGSWKLVAIGVDGAWELYAMPADRTELNDLAAKDPARVKKMADQWHEIAQVSHVYPLDGRSWNERVKPATKPATKES